MELKAALENWQDRKARRTILATLRGRQVIALNPDGSPNVDETLEGWAYAEKRPAVALHGHVTPEKLYEGPEPERAEADPITRSPLYRGKTTIGVALDWSPVAKDRRLIAAYAVESGQVPQGGSELAIHALTQTSPPPPWGRLQQEWEALRNRKDAQAHRRVAAIEERLFEDDAEPAPAEVPPRPFGAAEPPAAPIPAAPGAVAIYVIHADSDRRAWDELRTNLIPMMRAGLISIVAQSDCRPGANVRAFRQNHITSAAIIMVLVSPAALNECGDDIDAAAAQRARGARVVPVNVRPALLDFSPLKLLEALPDDGVKVAQGIRRIIGR